MESIALGKGLYLKPYKTGLGLCFGTKRGKKNFEITLPNRALTNYDLVKYAKLLKIPHFRGVFMRDELPSSGARYRESAIVNLDDSIVPGPHWVAYRKCGKSAIYFDSFGDLQPPRDLMNYLKVPEVLYNHERYQKFDTYCLNKILVSLSNDLIVDINGSYFKKLFFINTQYTNGTSGAGPSTTTNDPIKLPIYTINVNTKNPSPTITVKTSEPAAAALESEPTHQLEDAIGRARAERGVGAASPDSTAQRRNRLERDRRGVGAASPDST
ncbi:unnamed protein product, partial [Trichogramma brassicae]